MKVLIIGNGGREHALAWKIKQSPKVTEIFVAPGNAGTAEIATNLDLIKIEGIIAWLSVNPVDLVVVGPDNYLANGIVDQLEALHIPVFGPTRMAAQIEWSKSFAKQFMIEEGIPTANYRVFTQISEAKSYVKEQKYPLVIKASGLALGKGVVIVENVSEAIMVLDEIMEKQVYGSAGSEVVIEEFLLGKEIYVHALCDGKNVALFPSAQDHKRIFENDKGPNTGGMGTIAPVPWVTTAMMEEIKNSIVLPTIRALEKRDMPFKGILFPGIMFTATGPKVIEFNARFGDPETQSYMRLLESDLVDIILAYLNGTLDTCEIKWSESSACCIVCASGGYPGEYVKEKVIHGLKNNENKDSIVFHAGTKKIGEDVVTNGGRVLGVTATGGTLSDALSKGYESLKEIQFDGMQYRKDIGSKSIL